MEKKETLSLIEKFARANNIPVILEPSCDFLAEICKKKQPKKILEIGTAIGYSGTIMLQNSKEAFLTTIEKLESSQNLARKNFEEFGLLKRVELLLGDAYEVLKLLSGRKFDFIFLDGPKGQYIKYLPILLELLEIGGTLVADNVLYRGMVEKEGLPPKSIRTIVVNLRKFLEEISTNEKLETQLFHIGDGISVSVLKGEK